MRLRDYFVGRSFRLTTRHSPQVVAERINAAAASNFWPFYSETVVGGVWLGRIRLRFVSSPFEYNLKPVLAGRLREARSGSILTLRYRAPVWAYLFNLVWCFCWGLVVLMMLGQIGEPNPDLTGSDYASIWGLVIAMLFSPLAMHYFGTRKSDEELGYLLDFLAERAGAAA